MDKKEFLTQLGERVNSITVYQPPNVCDIDSLKARLIPIIQKEFIEYVPTKINRGRKIKIQSRGFRLERGLENIYFLLFDGTCERVGDWCNGLSILQQEIVEDLSKLVEREVKATTENKFLSFYFYW